MDNLIKLLEKLGLSTDKAVSISKNEDFNIDEVYTSIKSEQKKLLTNDPEFISQISSKVKLEELSKIDKFVKKLYGLSSDEGKDMRTEELISMAKERNDKKLIDTYKNSTESTLSTELENTRQMLAQAKQEIERLTKEEIPSISAKAKAELEEHKKDLALERYIEKYPLVVPLHVAYPSIANKIKKDGYKLGFNQSNELVLLSKDGFTPMNEDGSKFIYLNEYVQSHLNDWGLVKQSNANNTNTKEQTYTTPEMVASKVVSPSHSGNGLLGLQKAEENSKNLTVKRA